MRLGGEGHPAASMIQLFGDYGKKRWRTEARRRQQPCRSSARLADVTLKLPWEAPTLKKGGGNIH